MVIHQPILAGSGPVSAQASLENIPCGNSIFSQGHCSQVLLGKLRWGKTQHERRTLDAHPLMSMPSFAGSLLGQLPPDRHGCGSRSDPTSVYVFCSTKRRGERPRISILCLVGLHFGDHLVEPTGSVGGTVTHGPDAA